MERALETLDLDASSVWPPWLPGAERLMPLAQQLTFNVVANWALIFGHLGLPAMGLEGAALATSATRVVLLLLLVAVTIRYGLHHGAWVPWDRQSFDRRGLAEVFRYGLPVALQYGLEMWAFQICTLMAGWLGKHELAAHSIVINMASVSFMMPLGISIGAAVRVGNRVGAGKPRAAQRAAMQATAQAGP